MHQGSGPAPPGVGSDFEDAPPRSPGQKCSCICIDTLLRMHLYTHAPICMHMYSYVDTCLHMHTLDAAAYVKRICVYFHTHVSICQHTFYVPILVRHMHASACIYHHLPAPTITGGVHHENEHPTPGGGGGRAGRP